MRAFNLFRASTITIIALIITVTISIVTTMSIASETNNLAIKEAAKTHTYLFIFYSLLLLATVIVSVFVWLSSNKYQDAVKRNADAQIATAKATADTAKVDIKKAEEKIAIITTEAEIKQKELEQENLKLRGEVANLQIKAADAQRALLELQERIRPRRLKDEQRTQLIGILKNDPNGTILIRCLNGDAESCSFAKQIADTLSSAGWLVNGPRAEILFGKESRPPVGLFIIVQSQKSPIRAIALQKALVQIGFTVPGDLNQKLEPDEVQLFVGVKP